MRKALTVVAVLAGAFLLSPTAPAQLTPPFLTGSPEDVFLAPAPAPPGGGEGALPLSEGEERELACGAAQEGGGVLCGPQFVIEVPEGGTGLTLNVSADADFVVFVRFGDEVALDQGRAVADLNVQSRQGGAVFHLPTFQPGEQFAGLQPGRYFFALAHFETRQVRFTASGRTTSPRPLALGETAQLTCSPAEILCLQQFTLRLSQASGFDLDVRASGEFLALIRFSEPVELPPLTFDDQGLAQVRNPISDFSATAEGGQAVVTVDGASSPPAQAGTYYVALANLDSTPLDFSLSARQAGTSESNRAPEARFGVSPAQPRAGERVQFTDDSVDPDGSIDARSWDFGDGTTSSEANPSHTYAAPGTYRVLLTVTDDGGRSAEAVQTLTVVSGPSPTTEAGLRAVAFARLGFVDPAAWTRAVEQGCVVYANVSEAEALVQLTTPDGGAQSVAVPAGGTVLVCGNVAHFGA